MWNRTDYKQSVIDKREQTAIIWVVFIQKVSVDRNFFYIIFYVLHELAALTLKEQTKKIIKYKKYKITLNTLTQRKPC